MCDVEGLALCSPPCSPWLMAQHVLGLHVVLVCNLLNAFN